MNHSLEHVRDPLNVLTRAKQHLKPGGYLYVASPNWSSWQSRTAKEDWEWYSFPDHLWHFTPLSIQLLLRQAEFEPLKVETSMGAHGGKEVLRMKETPIFEEAVNLSLNGQNLMVWARSAHHALPEVIEV